MVASPWGKPELSTFLIQDPAGGADTFADLPVDPKTGVPDGYEKVTPDTQPPTIVAIGELAI